MSDHGNWQTFSTYPPETERLMVKLPTGETIEVHRYGHCWHVAGDILEGENPFPDGSLWQSVEWTNGGILLP